MAGFYHYVNVTRSDNPWILYWTDVGGSNWTMTQDRNDPTKFHVSDGGTEYPSLYAEAYPIFTADINEYNEVLGI
jgi:hypothetical protein